LFPITRRGQAAADQGPRRPHPNVDGEKLTLQLLEALLHMLAEIGQIAALLVTMYILPPLLLGDHRNPEVAATAYLHGPASVPSAVPVKAQIDHGLFIDYLLLHQPSLHSPTPRHLYRSINKIQRRINRMGKIRYVDNTSLYFVFVFKSKFDSSG
jgi:hypothetical protein